MKKIILIFCLLIALTPLSLGIVANNVAYAQDGVALTDPISGAQGGQGGLEIVDNLVIKVIKYILGIIGVIALIAFVYGGFTWLTSYGDTNKITKGKNVVVWAIMGLIIIFGSYAIVGLMFGIFGVGK